MTELENEVLGWFHDRSKPGRKYSVRGIKENYENYYQTSYGPSLQPWRRALKTLQGYGYVRQVYPDGHHGPQLWKLGRHPTKCWLSDIPGGL